MDRPFIVRFENQQDKDKFDVVIHHNDCSTATVWVKEYFSLMTVVYLHSDFEGNHTYHIQPRS
jgi:hypothetical protein